MIIRLKHQTTVIEVVNNMNDINEANQEELDPKRGGKEKTLGYFWDEWKKKFVGEEHTSKEVKMLNTGEIMGVKDQRTRDQLQDPVQRANITSKVILADISKAIDYFYEVTFKKIDKKIEEQFPNDLTWFLDKRAGNGNEIWWCQPDDQGIAVSEMSKPESDKDSKKKKRDAKPAIVGEASRKDPMDEDTNWESEDDDLIVIDVTGIVNIDISDEEKAKDEIAKKVAKKERENGNALCQSLKERLKKITKIG